MSEPHIEGVDPTQGCDLMPFQMTPVPGEINISFGFDYAVEIGFVRDGEVVWSTAGSPILLSDLLAAATAGDLAAVVRELAVSLARRRAATSMQGA